MSSIDSKVHVTDIDVGDEHGQEEGEGAKHAEDKRGAMRTWMRIEDN